MHHVPLDHPDLVTGEPGGVAHEIFCEERLRGSDLFEESIDAEQQGRPLPVLHVVLRGNLVLFSH